MTDLLLTLLTSITVNPLPPDRATTQPAARVDWYQACAEALPAGTRVLFQGDSITDMNRGRDADPNHLLGHSYAFLIAGRIGAAHPEKKLEFINRGASGNKVADLAKRWQADAIELKSDVLSILVGVNDLNFGTSAEDYATNYDRLLADTRAALPNVKLILLEPFGLPTGAKRDGWAGYSTELTARRAIVQSLAKKYGARCVPLQAVFEAAATRADASFWIWDGVHPTYAGQQLIADAWVMTMAHPAPTTRPAAAR
jgi:lysophospholipase L1-like esterase